MSLVVSVIGSHFIMSGEEGSRLFFSLCKLQSRSRVSVRVSAAEKDVDHICAERLQGDGRLEDNVFISSYSQSCQLGSCASGEGRPQYCLKERQTVSLKSHVPLAAAVNHTNTFRLMLLLLRRPVVCALPYLFFFLSNT